MIQFGLDEYTYEMEDWSKGHKQVGVIAKREYENDIKEPVLAKDQALRDLLEKYPERVKRKPAMFYDAVEDKTLNAWDSYVLLDNKEYVENDVNYYDTGAMNTKQTSHIRLTFLLEYDKFIADIEVKSSGSYAPSMYGLLSGFDAIEDWLDDLAEKPDALEKHGIEFNPNDEDEYRIVLVSEYGEARDVEMPRKDLLEALVGVELYKFDQEITDD